MQTFNKEKTFDLIPSTERLFCNCVVAFYVLEDLPFSLESLVPTLYLALEAMFPLELFPWTTNLLKFCSENWMWYLIQASQVLSKERGLHILQLSILLLKANIGLLLPHPPVIASHLK